MSNSVRSDSGCFLPLFSTIIPVLESFNIFKSEVDPTEMFYETVKNFSEEEIIKYVQEGYRPPQGQAFKIRKKKKIQRLDESDRSTKLEKSIVILANGTIFHTGKREDLNGRPSTPGGSESKLLGEGKRKRAFLIKDLNTGKHLVIKTSKQKINPCLDEMKKESFVTNNISSSLIQHVRFYSRTTKCMKMKVRTGYLESEFCNGTLAERPELAQDLAIQSEIRQAILDVHEAGFVHLDIHKGNIGYIVGPDKKLSVRLLDFGNAERHYPNDRMEEVDHFLLKKALEFFS